MTSVDQIHGAGLLERVSGYQLKKSGKITRSNWGALPLTENQLAYAAADAYAGRFKEQ
jgi:ribonuclease D